MMPYALQSPLCWWEDELFPALMTPDPLVHADQYSGKDVKAPIYRSSGLFLCAVPSFLALFSVNSN